MTSGVRPSPWQAAVRRASTAAPKSKCGMRNGECGIEEEGSIGGACIPTRGSHGPFRIPHSAFRILSLAKREEVRKQPIGAGHTRGQLSKEAQPGVKIRALADRGHEEPALKRRLAGIVQLDERRVG